VQSALKDRFQDGFEPAPQRALKVVPNAPKVTPPKADAGKETPKADAGKETPKADAGKETPKGDAGKETPKGDAGKETPKGDAGKETPKADAGKETPKGDAGKETPKGDAGKETPKGDAGKDTPKGDAGKETPKGDAGKDTPKGDAGKDTPKGDAGKDTPKGDADKDALKADAGKDAPKALADKETPKADADKKPEDLKNEAQKTDEQKKTEEDKKAAEEKKAADEAKAKEEAEKRRKEEMDRLLAKPEVRRGMQQLGLSEDEIRQAGDAGLKLLEAAEHAGKGNYKDAARSLLAAGRAAPDLVAKAASKLADKFSDPTVKALLKNGDFVKALATSDTSAQALDHFMNGNFGEGLKALAGNEKALGAAVDTLYATNPAFKKGLDALGVKPETLKQNLAAAPDLVDAAMKASRGDIPGALKSLVEAGKKAPDVMSEIISNYAKKIPDSVPGAKYLRAIFGDKDAVKSMLTDSKAHAGLGKLLNGDLRGLRDLAGSEAAEKVVKALAKEPGIADQLKKMGLTGDDVAQLVKAGPDALDAIMHAADGKLGDAFKSMMSAMSKAPDVAAKLIKQMASKIDPNGPLGWAQPILANEKAMGQLLHDPKAMEALGRLGAGDMSALRDLVNSQGGQAVIDALGESPKVKDLLARVGLEPKDLKSLAQALPDVLDAASKLKDGDWKGALQSLKTALGNIDPAVAAKMLGKIAGNIPNLPGPLKALLTDPKFMGELLNNPAARSALDKLMAGNPMDAARELLNNPEMRQATAEALFRDPATKKLFENLGIKTPEALAAMGKAAGDVMDAVQKIGQGDIRGAMQALGKAWGGLSAQQKADLISGLADHLKLPPGVRDALKLGAEVLGTPGVADALGKALEAVKKGDVGALGNALAEAGKLIAKSKPELAVSFLNSLQHLPGSLGKLFKDPKLNEAIVRSGAFDHLLDAMASLSNADLRGALGHLASAGQKLITDGEHFNIRGIGELPIGKQGMENMLRLMDRFWDALPSGVKHKLEAKMAQMAASLGLRSVPFLGNLVNLANLGMDAAALVKEMLRDNPDATTLFLQSLQVGVDVAGLVPGLNTMTAPLAAAVAMMNLIGGPGLVGNRQDYQNELLDLREPGGPARRAA
jgi:hypothetical protein